jgi:hypothetical protein
VSRRSSVLRVHSPALLLTTTICLLGQAAAFAHLALVRHASCPQHADALVHAPAGAARPADLPRSLPLRAGSGLPAGGDHGDDHCLLAAFRRTGLSGPVPERGLVLAPARSLTACRVVEQPDRPAPVALLRLAPKSSPPIAG